MRGVKKLENLVLVDLKENIFLIDWLTFVSHSDTVLSLKELLGLAGQDIPWDDRQVYRNGYPMQCQWNGITISYGADDERFVSEPGKVRDDMGICVNLSGTGCRAVETYGNISWFALLERILHSGCNVTRLDLAYDDHSGILDISRIEHDIRDRLFVSPAKKFFIEWSDDQDEDIQGLSCYIGSPQSDLRVRIYNKAAERGYDSSQHWIRVELQLRKKRAIAAVAELLKRQHIGDTVCGILRNYITFREPTNDTNKSRWPIADYWLKLLRDMERISLWISPGEPYNFSKTEMWLRDQCGQALLTAMKLHTLPVIIAQVQEKYPVLAPKYQRAIAEIELQRKQYLDGGDTIG